MNVYLRNILLCMFILMYIISYDIIFLIAFLIAIAIYANVAYYAIKSILNNSAI